MVVGTPEQVADEIEAFFTAGAADGFNLNHDFYPVGLDLIVDHLVPELQRRGLFRKEYESTTLRGHLGLPLPIAARV
jgi:alkanesulfonate monooxygenase SsuD/methylene tetrahydromethanopterin reductase-like flavin-dependent oxidoreductase (luciferase family)